ncbi:MAG: YdcF family protein [Eubacteriales bacterium]|nr:YdcF family protein [Eubacteriales bacterium]
MYQKFLSQVREFIFTENAPEKADIIFVPGNGYPQNAERAAELYEQGFAPLILPSGRYSISTGRFSGVLERQECYPGPYETEWEFLKDVLVKNGVPESAVLREDKATYTYQNALFSKKVTDAKGLDIRTAILCCKNYHARRCLMYYQEVYSKTRFLVCPSVIGGVNRENWNQTEEGIREVTGEINRIIQQFSLLMSKSSCNAEE